MPRLFTLGILVAALLSLAPIGNALAGNDPPPISNYLWGFYFSNFTLTAAAPGPNYHVVGDVFIQPGVTMTVEPGVTVFFSANRDTLNGSDYFYDSEIVSEGSIVAIGTQVDSISFTSDASTKAQNDWGQIKISGNGSGTFQFCKIEYPSLGINKSGPNSLSVQNCSFKATGNNSVWAKGGNVTIRNSRITVSYGDGMSFSSLTSLVCQYNRIEMVSGMGLLCQNCSNCNVSFNQITQAGAYGIYTNDTNAAIQFNRVSNCNGLFGINVNSHSLPIVVLGDTVDGGNETRGILMTGGQPDTVRNCLVMNLPYAHGIYAAASGVSIENCLVHHVDTHGIYLGGPSTRAIYSTVSNCRDGVYVAGSGCLVKDLITVNNLWFGVENTSGSDVSYVNSWNNGSGQYSGLPCSVGCYSINPWFVNPASGDYHLLQNAPLRVLGEGGTQMGRYGPAPGDVTGVGPGGSYPVAYLFANSPNPFKGQTTISFLSRESGLGVVQVFDVNGRKLREMQIRAEQGLNEIRFERGDLGPGLYFYRVSLPGFREVRKLVITD